MCREYRDIKGAYTGYKVLATKHHKDKTTGKINHSWMEIHLEHDTVLVVPIKGFHSMNLRVGDYTALYTKKIC